MLLVTVSSLLFLLFPRTVSQQIWTKDPLILRVYPSIESSEEDRIPVKEPPLKRGVSMVHGGLKRDMSVYPAAGSQLMPRIPLREPPLKRSVEFFVERRSASLPLDLLRLPVREPPLVKRSISYPPYMHIPLKEPPLKRSIDILLNHHRRFW